MISMFLLLCQLTGVQLLQVQVYIKSQGHKSKLPHSGHYNFKSVKFLQFRMSRIREVNQFPNRVIANTIPILCL